jgi:hypothetical protein
MRPSDAKPHGPPADRHRVTLRFILGQRHDPLPLMPAYVQSLADAPAACLAPHVPAAIQRCSDAWRVDNTN